ncbi:hypothetical protein ACQBAU_07540 [Propionibacteriaceae bacterium Y2011]
MSAATPTAEALVQPWRSIDRWYARFHAPLAVLALVLTFLPYYGQRSPDTRQHGNLWQEVIRSGSAIDLFALVLMLLIVLLLALAALERLPAATLLVLAGVALVLGLMLVVPPGYRERPPFTQAGVVDVVLLFTVTALALAQAVHGLVLKATR